MYGFLPAAAYETAINAATLFAIVLIIFFRNAFDIAALSDKRLMCLRKDSQKD